MKKILLALVTLALAAPNYAQDFTALSEEGVEISFFVVSEDEKTCATAEEGCIPFETEGKVTIPAVANGYTVIYIGCESFAEYEGLTEVVIPSTIKGIDERAFQRSSVEVVTMLCTDGTNEDHICEINRSAFGDCTNLTKVTLSDHVRYIERAFIGCSALTEVYSYAIEPYELDDAFPYENEDLTLYVPAGTKELYEEADGWSDFPNIVEMGGTTGIKDVNAAAVMTTRYHNLAGMTSDKPFPGINLVTTTYTDGTITTHKMVE